jgi:hypothetical protein
MQKQIKIISTVFFFSLSLAFADDVEKQGIKVDDSNFQTLYGKNIESLNTNMENDSSFDLFKMKLSSLSFNELVLENRYFKVPYSDYIGSTPVLEFEYLSRFYQGNKLGFYLSGGLGYSYLEKRLTLLSPEGGRIDDLVKTHRIPLTFGPLAELTPFNSDFFSAYFSPKIGLQWFYQSGKVDGVTQNFLVTLYEAEAGIKVFGNSGTDSILSGLNLFASYLGTLSSTQKVSGLKFGLGAHLNL